MLLKEIEIEPQIICAAKYFESLQKKYPKRKITASVFCDDTWIYWYRGKGKAIVHIDVKDNFSLWVATTDNLAQLRKLR